MAKNVYGFIAKRHPQPYKYEKFFSSWSGMYKGKDGKEYMIEAVPHFLALRKEDAEVHEYLVLRRDEDCRRIIGRSKTQKGAIEILSKYVEFKPKQ